MFFSRKNRRRLTAGTNDAVKAHVTSSHCESLEFRQMLTSATVSPDAVATADDVNVTDLVFADIATSGTAQTTSDNDARTSSAATLPESAGSTHQDVMFASLPSPPSIPVGLGRDLTTEGREAVNDARAVYNSINDLRQKKQQIDQVISGLEDKLGEATLAATLADAAKADKEAALKNAVDKNKEAVDKLADLNSKLDQLKEDLATAKRIRKSAADAISLIGRRAKEARQAGNIALADSLGRQVGVNFEKYREAVNNIKSLKNQIRSLQREIRSAKREVRTTAAAVRKAERCLKKVAKAAAVAEQRRADLEAKLNKAKKDRQKLCDELEAKETEYLGSDGETGLHGAAADAISEGEQRRDQRVADEKAAQDQAAAEAAKAALRKRNQVQRVDLEAPTGVSKADINPCDITRLIAQQFSDTIPSNPTGNQLARAAAIKAFKAKAAGEAIRSVGNTLLSAAYDQLKNLIPTLAAVDALLNDINGFTDFIEDFKDGNLKHQRDEWGPEWGRVVTETVYNTKTGQYITTVQVVFAHPDTYTPRAGGAGRDGIIVAPHQALKTYTVTFVGTVKC